ncbi:MAG: glycoside hydrolase family 2 [Clostridia bacterium]|nr:glycoside hydrolase family 2 [Clostridia bacterium]
MPWSDVYPRPQLKRESFYSLNGMWKLDGNDIKIPFPPESSLSGYKGDIRDEMVYTRSFFLPDGFAPGGYRVHIHFGAVDQVAKVYVNDRFIIQHEGGYLPFSADITAALLPGENGLRVEVKDDLSHDYPYGKQKKKRGGMWYTPVSGIWQSVWLEAVPQKHIENVRITPDMQGIDIEITSAAPWCDAEIEGKTLRIETNKAVRIDIENPRLWNTDDPYLYPLKLRTETDCIESYFALRTIEIKGNRILLNGQPVFLNGVLDQGYFRDGIYLPGDPAEYEKDILRMKELGFNLLRKHCKVEPEIFYYICDREGMLVMQDMVNSGPYNFIFDTALPTVGFKRKNDCLHPKRDAKRKAFFTRHTLETQARLHNHPCVVAYTIFNEGWGQFEADRHYEILKEADGSRIYDATSGWFAQKKSDVDSQHIYFRTKQLKPGKRPMLLSECGGFGYPVKDHMFNESAKYGYGSAAKDKNEFTSKIEDMWEKMILPAIPKGLCGAIITQLSDVEDEINGMYTYDRQICKVMPERMRALADKAKKML